MDSKPQEEKKNEDLIKGMRELEFKNVVTDLQSKKKTWDDLKIPDELKHQLENMKMDKPSII